MKRRPVSLALLFVRDLRVAGWRRWGLGGGEGGWGEVGGGRADGRGSLAS